MKLRFFECRIRAQNNYPGKDAPSSVLVVELPLDQKMARRLRCYEVVYAEKDVIRTNIDGKIGLTLSVEGADLEAGQELSIKPNLIYGFKIERREKGKGAERELGLFLSFRAKFSGRDAAMELTKFLCDTNRDEFSTLITGKQGTFDFDGDEDDPAPATRKEKEAAKVQ